MCVEAVKLPFFLAAESCWFGLCLVKLHLKLLMQLMKSSEVLGSACRGESQLLTPGAHLPLWAVYVTVGGQASLSLPLPPRAGYGQAPHAIRGSTCLAPSREHLTEQAVGVRCLWNTWHSKRAMPTATAVPFRDKSCSPRRGSGCLAGAG